MICTCLKNASRKATYEKCLDLLKQYLLKQLVSTHPLSCISMNNQVYKVRPEIINLYSNEPYFSHILL